MSTKKVTLDKVEYDAMEAELKDLRAIVRSRTVVQILEESLNWHLAYHAASGTRIKYILGTDSDEEKMKVLADQIEYVNKKLAKAESDLRDKSDEIKRLNKQTWYQKLFSKKTK